jgi:hypothetical protein
MSGIPKQTLAPVGSTGNNSHAPVNVHQALEKLCVEFVVESIGATPTVTLKLQGTQNDVANPASSDWEDIAIVFASNDAVVTTRAVTAVGRYLSFVSLAKLRFFKKVRLVTSANTNVTYSANLHSQFTTLG